MIILKEPTVLESSTIEENKHKYDFKNIVQQ